MNARRTLFTIMIAAVMLAACAPMATSSDSIEQPMYYGETTTSDGFAPPDAMAAEEAARTGGEAGGASAPAVVDRLVIKNASLTLVVNDPTEASSHIASVATSMGGFVVSSYVYQASVDEAGNMIMRANITVRVPSGQLDSALSQIREMAIEVRTENISGQDVTAEYTDMESRLRNLESAEAQLQRIMDGATRTEDVLSVFNQLTAIRQQIEQLKGQMQYYRDSAAMSAVTVELLPDALNRPIEIGGWRAQGVVRDALEALVRTGQAIATAGIWVGIYCVPLFAVIGLPALFILRLVMRRRKQTRA